MASFFFLRIKLNRLMVVFKNYSWFKQSLKNCQQSLFEFQDNTRLCYYSSDDPSRMSHNQVRQTLMGVSSSLLISAGENLDENENEWQILMRISGCQWIHEITKVKTLQERDTLWNRIFTSEPLKNVPEDHRWNWIGIMRLCSHLSLMRDILLRKPPKVVITGKSTLFTYLAGRNLEELRSIDAFNTRMSLQCPALIHFNDESILTTDIVDNPGQDDATGQAKTLLDMTLISASLFIVVTTLTDVNQSHTIQLIDRLLRETQINILILINQIDIRLFEERGFDWENDEETVAHTKIETSSSFSAFDTLKILIERPINELTSDQAQISNRVTIEPIILKKLKPGKESDLLREFSRIEEHFRSQVSKSNVKTWIIENLTESSNLFFQ
ncbi:unnamed protein product [Rotaria socialis]|uniref:Uncharacterized protein n=1 Tax=Rotaria socialis TaxID=392032 RepID=A0A818B490_9BILA|nr:unnamed protein product [Rotaria socialis]